MIRKSENETQYLICAAWCKSDDGWIQICVQGSPDLLLSYEDINGLFVEALGYVRLWDMFITYLRSCGMRITLTLRWNDDEDNPITFSIGHK